MHECMESVLQSYTLEGKLIIKEARESSTAAPTACAILYSLNSATAHNSFYIRRYEHSFSAVSRR